MSKPIFSDGIGYEGKITLTLKSGNRVLKSKTYKNNGTSQLFSFLGKCLIGSFEDAKKDLPRKIMLLKNESNTEAILDEKNVKSCSIFRSYTKTPAIVNDSNLGAVRVTYSFEIPKYEVENDFNQVALYGAETTDIKNFSAYYYLTNANGTLAVEEIGNWSATTVLLIEWELSLSNTNIATNSTQGGQG